jgi:hypothetical protein
MRRLHVLAEGQTEEAFVNQVLAPHLADHGVVADVRCVTTRRDRHRLDIVHRGGLREYGKVQRDLQRWMAEDRDAVFTTMLDLYALPRDFPGFEEAARFADPYARVRHLEKAMAAYIEHDAAIARLVELATRFPNPELIDDGAATAPSKRIIAEIPEYAFQKTTAGPLIASHIGVQTLRDRCPHFGEWITTLEALDG